MRSFLLIFLIVSAASLEYCETLADQTSFFMTANQKRIFPLGSYVRGFDLQFTVDDKSSAQLFNPTTLIESQDLQLPNFAQIRNIDIQKSPQMDGMGFAVILALKENNKQIGIWQGFFQGDRKLPTLQKFKTMVLPDGLQADCHDARVIDDQGEWFSLNCQTIPKSADESPQDLLCAVHQEHKQLSLNLNCRLYDSLLKSQSRSSKILSFEGLTYLLSSNLDLTASNEAISYISIYYLNSDNQFVFSNIIDGSSLTPSDMIISDFIITNDKTIIVADSKNSRVIFYSYDLPSQVTVQNVISYPGRPLALFYDHSKVTLFVGTKDKINEHLFSDPTKIINSYQIDPTDSLLTNIQVSKKFVAFRTQNNNYYIYERGQTKINYVLSMIPGVKQIPFVLSERNSYVYKFTTTKAETTYLAQPYIAVSKVDKDKVVNVLASSEGKVCNLKINLRYSQNDATILKKQDISTKSFKIDPINGLNLALDDYYAGADLSYKVKSNNQKDFTFEINHLNQYTFVPSFEATEASTILQINSVHFYYIGINSISESKAYIDFCTLQNGGIECQSHAIIMISKSKKSIEVIKAGQRSNGKSFVVWSYKYSGAAEWIYIESKSVGFSDYGYPLSYTSLHISDSYFLFLSKTGRVVQILFDKSPFNAAISESFFIPDQLKEVEYFYPRQVYVDHSDETIIYIKLPTKVAKFQILPNHQVVYVGIVLDLGEYQLDQSWSLSFDSQKVLLYRDNKISEWYFDPIALTYTKSFQLPYPTGSEPLNFDTKSNLLYTVSTSQNGESTVKIMKPFQGLLEFQYSSIKILGKPTLSGNWLLIDSEAQSTVYFIDSHPTLRATSLVPEDKFKEDVTLTLVVSNKDEQKQSATEFEGVNYPITIKDTPNNTLIVLPSQTKKLEVEIPIEKYFTGPVGYYSLSCPMCGGSRIHLYGPLASEKSIDNIPAILDFVTVGTQFVALASKKLYLMSSTEEVIFSLDILSGLCTNLQYNPAIGLLAFCKTETGQIVQKFKIEDKKISLVDTFTFHGDNRINYLDEMFAVNKGDNNYLFVLDNDETVDSNNKKSIVKMLDLSANLDLLGTWNSQTFGAQAYLPINDLEIIEDIVFVTIGNYGIGYGTLGKAGQLLNPSNIQLSNIKQIKDGFLDDTFFKQVQILTTQSTQKQLNVFITTTNARHIVITLNKTDKGYNYQALKQSYNRYGTQRLLNWHAVTSDSIYLSYYNSEYETVNLVHYKRSVNSIVNFNQGVLIRMPKSMVRYHEAIILNGKLIVSHLGSSLDEGELNVYNIRKNFIIWFSYGEAGDFNKIDIQAFNDYKSSVHSQPIKFSLPDPDPVDPEGIKWYIVVIICASVLVAVGAAYGMFIYMKKKRAEKNISLLTEKEQGAEENEENEENHEELQDTTKGGVNRSSINAYD